ncbi:hypothetical protein ONZ51_g13342 [Trametes cubensis]|uniref:Uncharacterized protein n=1 Tax=Trametes cubensis TaxID=1111947 RepID=A0AAD7TE99_9APHY|nr:hypothetical protein ONZ51_g13342 [Trametes cubensis]
MIIYPPVLVASLLFGTLSDLTVVLLGPIVTHYYIPLLGTTPAHFHSFASPVLPSGHSASVNSWSRYGSCVDLNRSLWGLSGLLTIPALADSTTSGTGLTVLALSFTASQEPLVFPRASTRAWPAAYLVNILVACHWLFVAYGYLVAFYWISRGFALAAYTFFYRLTYVVDSQRMDSPCSFYSVDLLAETSLCCCQSGAPELLVCIPIEVPRADPSLRPVPPALAEPRCSDSLPEPKKTEKTHRGRRGGKRQRRRHRASSRTALKPPPFLHPPVRKAFLLIPLLIALLSGTRRSTPLGDVHPDATFTSDGSGHVVSISNARSTYFVHPPRADEPAPPAKRPTLRTPYTLPPTSAATLLKAPPTTIVGRTYSPCQRRPTPATTAFRRKHSPAQTLGIIAVRVVPPEKLNQRARRAFAAQFTLGKFLNAHLMIQYSVPHTHYTPDLYAYHLPSF